MGSAWDPHVCVCMHAYFCQIVSYCVCTCVCIFVRLFPIVCVCGCQNMNTLVLVWGMQELMCVFVYVCVYTMHTMCMYVHNAHIWVGQGSTQHCSPWEVTSAGMTNVSKTCQFSSLPPPQLFFICIDPHPHPLTTNHQNKFKCSGQKKQWANEKGHSFIHSIILSLMHNSFIHFYDGWI